MKVPNRVLVTVLTLVNDYHVPDDLAKTIKEEDLQFLKEWAVSGVAKRQEEKHAKTTTDEEK